ncbi:hypothetical protein BKA62DRAFT_675677 [Auriculariales sp. MPI-PUGE-AT-0066]|nr:hypothetical protein BKA62DRAFT_675677 [Auriculariales sp. MPI-PUGE-AT-0066]
MCPLNEHETMDACLHSCRQLHAADREIVRNYSGSQRKCSRSLGIVKIMTFKYRARKCAGNDLYRNRKIPRGSSNPPAFQIAGNRASSHAGKPSPLWINPHPRVRGKRRLCRAVDPISWLKTRNLHGILFANDGPCRVLSKEKTHEKVGLLRLGVAVATPRAWPLPTGHCVDGLLLTRGVINVIEIFWEFRTQPFSSKQDGASWHYGQEIIASALNASPTDPNVDLLYLKLYKARFETSSALTGTQFTARLQSYVLAWLPARGIVRAAFDARSTVNPSGRIVLFTEYAHESTQDHLYNLDQDAQLGEGMPWFSSSSTRKRPPRPGAYKR